MFRPPALDRNLCFLVFCGVESNLIFDSCRDSFGCLFYRRPPPVVFRGESQPPPLKLLGATSVSVRMNFPMSFLLLMKVSE